MDKKLGIVKSDISISDSVIEAPQIAEDSNEVTEYKVKECTEENTDGNECYETQGASNFQNDILVYLEDQISGINHMTSSSRASITNITVPNPSKLATKNRACASRTNVANTEDSDGNCSPKVSSVNSPRSVKSLQLNSPTLSRKLVQNDDKKPQDDDCWSQTSSAAGSVRAKVTIASAPVFKCTERAEKRKEFYKKLEEKHRAIEEERKQSKARIKEEQDAVLKQQRRNMTYRANPVPDFYRHAPPPKPELKKLPVTEPKSPKFNTSVRKNRSGIATSPVEESARSSARPVGHSTGTDKQETPSPSNRKIQSNGRSRLTSPGWVKY